MTRPLRVVIAEDNYLVREGVRRALTASGELEVVAAVGTADELVDVAERERPDVVVTDIRMPPGHKSEGIEAAHRIRAAQPSIGIVVLSQYAEASYARELLRDGNDGVAYLLKERVGDRNQLVNAVRSVAEGGSIVDPDVVAALVARSSVQQSSAIQGLTRRERDVLQQMAQGRTNASIADQLHLSESTVEKYSTSIFAKLGLRNEPAVHRRVAAVITYLDEQGRATDF
ncbi:MAG TPA: response regulator transcription factor [Nitriliruptoraceae bacterium]|nr:response regulator transcription factor [Nitriliruptoraceae bacterium]